MTDNHPARPAGVAMAGAPASTAPAGWPETPAAEPSPVASSQDSTPRATSAFGGDLRRPAWLERVPTNIAGQPTTRLIFIFRAPGCTYARRPGGGCTMCGFTPLTAGSEAITADDLIAQFDDVFPPHSGRAIAHPAAGLSTDAPPNGRRSPALAPPDGPGTPTATTFPPTAAPRTATTRHGTLPGPENDSAPGTQPSPGTASSPADPASASAGSRTPPVVTSADLGEVDLFNSGSFLADDEMPPAVRAHVFRRLAQLDLRRVVIESRPEFVTSASLREASVLPPGVLEVGIGLESADDHIREVLIRKGFDRPAFERAAAVLAKAGAGLLVNVLLKPPGLADDNAAVADALATGRYVADLARRLGLPARLALQPVFVAPGTALEAEFRAGRYQPPSLWAVVAAVRGLHPLLDTTVGLSDEGLEPHLSPAGCGRCDEPLRAALRDYNRTRDLSGFDTLSCPCQGDR